MMRSFATDLKIGFLALLVTLATAIVVLFLWYRDYQVSKNFLFEAQKVSSTLPILAVTEGQLSKWTDEIRKNETVKGEMEEHFIEQINKIRKGEYKADQFNQHLLSCKKFCSVLLDKIFASDTREISKIPHEIVFFGLDKDALTARYQKKVQEFMKRNQSQTIVLVGRASYIGGAGYNKELSGRRVKRVKEVFRRYGLSEEQLKPFWLGFEAPQLTRELADLYNIDPEEYKEDLFNLNQSVVMYTYTPGQYFPGVVNTMRDHIQQKTPSLIKAKQKG
jgi:outer membrane protein OmpA-like peptidoglycan-associated protein